MLDLRVPTVPAWTRVVLADLDAFLIDHAACERKASATAMSFVVRYPDRPALIEPMIALAREELEHFHQVYKLLAARDLRLGPDRKDPYIAALMRELRVGRDPRLLDRLVLGGIVEARGCERFGLIAAALPEGALKRFYTDITRSEARHQGLFLRLARQLFDAETVRARVDELLTREAEIVAGLPLHPALH